MHLITEYRILNILDINSDDTTLNKINSTMCNEIVYFNEAGIRNFGIYTASMKKNISCA